MFSDGADTLEDMCRAGKSAGLSVFGISDHWVATPWGKSPDWSIKPDKLDEYVGRVLKLKTELDDEHFSLKLGLEVDFFYENIDEVLADLKKYPFDYLIGSVHFAGEFALDTSKDDWLVLGEVEKDALCREYWEKLSGAAQRKEFAFIGHLDLPKKFAQIDDRKYWPEAEKVLDEVQKNGGTIELNTAGFFKECAEQYPAAELLRSACRRKIPVIVNADAHCKDHVVREFDRAAQILTGAGYVF